MNAVPSKILVAAHDPGGTHALVPVIVALKENPIYEVRILASTLAQAILQREGIASELLSTHLSFQEAQDILKQKQPNLLLTATSWNSNAEQQLRNVAYRMDIKVVTVLDFWSNADIRWREALYPIEDLYDQVCVMDEGYKNYMVSQGFPASALIVTGHPFLERLENTHKPVNSVCKNIANTFLFLSQPKESVLLDYSKGHPIRHVIDNLEQYSQKIKIPCSLTIKTHPKENKDDIISALKNVRPLKLLSIKIAERTVNLDELINGHDVILGYYSMALFQARAAGKKTFSVDCYKCEGNIRLVLDEHGVQVLSAGDGWPDDVFAASLKEVKTSHQGAVENICGFIKNSLSQKVCL